MTELEKGPQGVRRGRGARERIVSASQQLFRDQGINGTGMDQLCAVAGVSKRTLYQHFAGKDELVNELYVVIQRDHRERAEQVITQGGSLSENLAAVLHSGLDVLTPYHAFGGAFLQAAGADSSTGDRDFRYRLDMYRKAYGIDDNFTIRVMDERSGELGLDGQAAA